MLTFWIIAVVLTLLALAFVIPPLLSREKLTETVERREMNVAIYQERLDELQLELDKQNISAQQFATAKLELDQTLLQEVTAESPAPVVLPSRWQWPSAVAVAVLVPAIAMGLYVRYGEFALLSPEAVKTAAPHGEAAGMDSVLASVQQLAERLQQQPDDVDGWIMLARSYSMLEDAQAAAEAYAKAIALMTTQDPDILAEYAEVLAAVHGGKMQGQPEILVQAALHLDPDNQRALFFAGIAATQRQAFAEAVVHWERLLGLVPDDQGEIKAVLQEQVAKAREFAASGVTPSASDSKPESASASIPASQAATETTENVTESTPVSDPIQIQVHVALSPDAQSQVAETDTVFILIRAADGPPMPLAVVRKTVAELPFTVTLSESMAMMPNMTLANFANVYAMARVSRSGQPTAQPGDWQGKSDTFNPREQRDVIQIVMGERVD
ncbi:c-type cytochrome biogenesis protein CcmI [Thioflexithrix psekupsensis]|uniref:C-type cytochrome biogenesis protein CcmI n=1 Tax=Thioflexithrix psekupsensis TaxID=1570016 RepID=A0A251X6H3_9GAMM|nr:c-type cytochrome biogenesis protein CcmI [Thioflexithrix psekupsensis]OUD13197.1 c-type cytochrome biogenesis protein CcmI [Thioflexithrix psekupsensis]